MQSRTKKNWGKDGRKSGLSLVLMTSKNSYERNKNPNFLSWPVGPVVELSPSKATGHASEAPASPKEERKEKPSAPEKQSREWNSEPSPSRKCFQLITDKGVSSKMHKDPIKLSNYKWTKGLDTSQKKTPIRRWPTLVQQEKYRLKWWDPTMP